METETDWPPAELVHGHGEAPSGGIMLPRTRCARNGLASKPLSSGAAESGMSLRGTSWTSAAAAAFDRFCSTNFSPGCARFPNASLAVAGVLGAPETAKRAPSTKYQLTNE